MAEEELAALRMKLSLKDMDYTHSMDAIEQKLKGVNSEFNVAKAGVAGFEKTLDGMAAKQDKLGRVLDLQKKRVQTLSNMYKESSQSAGEDAKQTDVLKTKYNNALAAMKRTESQLGRVSEQLKEQSSAWRKTSDDVDKSVSGMRQKIAVLNSNYKVLTAGVDNFGNKTSQLQQQSSHLTSVLSVEAERVALLKSKYDALVSAKGKDDRETMNAEIAMNRANASLAKTQSELTGVNQKLSAFGSASRRLDSLSQKAQTVSDKMSGLGRAMVVGVSLPVGGLFAAGAKSYLSFNQELTTMRSLLNDGSVSAGTLNQQIAHLGQLSQNWSQSYGESTTSINDGMMELIKKGYTYNQVVGAMPSLLDAARSSGDDFNTVMGMATSTVEQFGLKSNNTQKMLQNTQRAVDDLTFVANKTAAGFSDMGTAMEYVGPVANSVGYSLEDTAAAIGLLSNNGLLADKAGTALRGAMSRLLKPTKQSMGAFEEMGLSTAKVRDGMYTLPDLIDTINKGTQGMNKAEKAHLITQGFGVEAQTGMNILLSQGGDALRKLSKDESNATGYTKKLSDQMGDTAQAKVKRLQASFHVLEQEIGKELVPEITPLIDKAAKLIKEFGDLPDSTKHAIVSFGLTAAAAGPVVLALGGVTNAVGTLGGRVGKAIGWLSKFRAAASVAGAASKVEGAAGIASMAGEAGGLTGALGLLLNPVTLTAAGLGTLGFVGYEAYKHMHELADTSTKSADALLKQHDQLKKQINDFETLKSKSSLTTKEFGRFIDIQTLLKKVKSPEEIKKLRDEQDKLRNKSGLSNKQLQTMVDLNNLLTKKVPGATDAITKQGNRIATTTDKMKKYNQSQLDQTIDKYQQKYNAALGNELKIRQQINSKQDQLNSGRAKEKSLQSLIEKGESQGFEALTQKYYKITQSNNATEKEKENAAKLYWLYKDHGSQLFKNLSDLEKQDNSLVSQIGKQKSQLSLAEKLRDKITHIILEENGVNDSKHKGIVAVDTEIAKQQSALNKLKQQRDAQKITNAQYNAGRDAINRQIDKLIGVRNKVIDATGSAKILNTTLSKKILKEIQFTGDTKKDALSINQALAKRVYKDVVVGVDLPAHTQIHIKEALDSAAGKNANGTSDWKGGLTWLAERGQEAVHVPGEGTGVVKKKGIYYLPAHASVLPNTKTEKMLAGLPGFANGIGNAFNWLQGKGGMSDVRVSLPELPVLISKLTSGIGDIVSKGYKNYVETLIADALGGGAKGTAYVKKTVAKALELTGKPASWAPALITIAMHESGGNPSAVNPIKVLGQHATGLFQMLPSTFAANKMKGYDNILDGLSSAIASARYISKRYGSPFNTPGIKSLAAGGKYTYYAAGTAGTPRTENAVLGDGGKAEPYLLPDGTLGVSPNKPTVFPKLPKGTVIWPDMKAMASMMPHYAKGTVSNKIADIRANYSMQKISIRTYINELKEVEKHYKLTAAQHRSLAVSISVAERKLANQSAAERKKEEAAVKKREKERAAALAKHKKQNDQLNKDIMSAANSYESKLKSINTTATNKINSLKTTYNNDLKSKQSDIYGQIGLFDEPSNSPAYKQDLTYNLKEQLRTQKQFNGDLSSLSKRKAPKALIQELQAAGIGSASQVHALTTMNSKELNNYISMWNQKHALANAEAKAELADEKKSTDQQIAAVKKSAEKQLTAAKTAFVAKLKSYKSIRTASSTLGSYAVAGIISGLKSQDGALKKELNHIANTIKSTIKKTLKIHSPSQVMRDEVGLNAGAGIVVGLNKSVPVVAAASQKLSAAVVPQVPLRSVTVPDISQARTASVQQTMSGSNVETLLNTMISALKENTAYTKLISKKDASIYLSGRRVTDDTSTRMADDIRRRQYRHGVRS